MSEHRHLPDPGREAAVAALIERFDNARHRPDRTIATRASCDGWRECLGCGSSSPGGPMYQCSGGGPTVQEWCLACHDETGNGMVWRYQIPWAKFYRLTARPPDGQLLLFAETRA